MASYSELNSYILYLFYIIPQYVAFSGDDCCVLGNLSNQGYDIKKVLTIAIIRTWQAENSFLLSAEFHLKSHGRGKPMTRSSVLWLMIFSQVSLPIAADQTIHSISCALATRKTLASITMDRFLLPVGGKLQFSVRVWSYPLNVFRQYNSS